MVTVFALWFWAAGMFYWLYCIRYSSGLYWATVPELIGGYVWPRMLSRMGSSLILRVGAVTSF